MLNVFTYLDSNVIHLEVNLCYAKTLEFSASWAEIGRIKALIATDGTPR